MCGLKPPPIPRLMHGDTKAQPVVARYRGPGSDHVTVRTEIHRIPGMMPGVPGIKTVVMIGERDEDLGARFLVTLDQFLGLPVEQRPLRAKLLIAEPGGMAIVLELVLVVFRAFHIHVARVP